MRLLHVYREIKNNYRSLSLTDKFIIWLEFMTKPFDELFDVIPKEGKIFDLGCGIGMISHILAARYEKLQILGIDPSQERIALAKDVKCLPPNLKFQSGTIKDVNEKDFDAILMVDVEYLLPQRELEKTLNECRDRLKSNGVIIIKSMSKAHQFKHFLTKLSTLLASAAGIFGSKLPMGSQNFFYKVFGARKVIPKFYYPEEYKKFFESNGWHTQYHDIARGFCPYPHIIFICAKKQSKETTN